MLKHASAMIRQKTLKALKTLYFPHETDLSRTVGPRTGSPLSMAKMVKMISKEKDSGVVSVLLRLVKVVITVSLLRILGRACSPDPHRRRSTSSVMTRNGHSCWRLSLRRRRGLRSGRSCFEMCCRR